MGSPKRTGDGIRMALGLGARMHVLGTMMMCGAAIKGMGESSQLLTTRFNAVTLGERAAEVLLPF